MATRVQVTLDEKELSAIKARARRDGMSVSAWMRAAARVRLEDVGPRFGAAELDAFFKRCDARERGQEPGWVEHLVTIDRSSRSCS